MTNQTKDKERSGPLRFFGMVRDRGLRRTLRYARDALYEKNVEKRLNIVTTGILKPEESGIDAVNQGGYQAVDYHFLNFALKQLKVGDRDVFLDYGSGMGRATLFAATFPIRKSLGVELSSSLHEAACRNLQRARSRLKCSDVEFVNDDALSYELPPEVTLINFFHPFSGELLEGVLAKICRSLAEHPRRLAILYQAPPWAKNRFEQLPEFKFRCKVPYFSWLPPGRTEPHKNMSAIYESMQGSGAGR
jgi:hypothetical protein